MYEYEYGCVWAELKLKILSVDAQNSFSHNRILSGEFDIERSAAWNFL